MDQSIKLRKAFQAMRAENRWPVPQPATKPSGTFQHFSNEEQHKRHLAQVKNVQKNGAPF